MYRRGPTCPTKATIPRKTVVLTGANCGLGRATAVELAKRKARIILACRDTRAAEDTVKYIRRRTKEGELIVKKLDLASLKSIKSFCLDMVENEKRIDVLVNNAGVGYCPFMRTDDGFELQMGVNHLGHFYLTNMLMEKLKDSAPSRVVVVSSAQYRKGKIDFDTINTDKDYDGRSGYFNSKLANCLFARELAKRLQGTGVSVHCIRPGMVFTRLGRHVDYHPVILALIKIPVWIMLRSPANGCQTTVYCAVAKELEGVTGRFYGECKEEPWADVALDDKLANDLWDYSVKVTNLVEEL
ncbi:hypothetical protein LSH36_605g02015 [Paralvinella palmiformis]|uniref:Retinol dehydrogenase 14 n=1 Tax=Paralvinella palmiformis TaxID=53620 RepID=A0AAD9J4I1_9ANNE|nr:hypothetical protein LSH36_605g02015 [Paralvinella palmiformis]